MSQPIPTGNFRWDTDEDRLNWSKLEEDGSTGVLLEIDDISKTIHLPQRN